jgi:hypothetical protein
VAIQNDAQKNPPPTRSIGAAEVLRRAAVTARSEVELHPRADQYIYVRSKTVWGPGAVRPGQPKGGEERQIWLSADGSKPELLRTSPCSRSSARYCDSVLRNDDAPGNRPVPRIGSYLWNLRNLQKQIDHIMATRAAPSPGNDWGKSDNSQWEPLRDMLGESYLPPRLRAAIFDALAKVPDVKTVGSTVDAAGRPAIAVSKTLFGNQEVLIFEPKTYRFLGELDLPGRPSTQIRDWRRQPPGSGFPMSFTVLEVKVADRLPPTRTR